MRVSCSKCGEEHELAELEPSLVYPDAVLDIPHPEREDRVYSTNAFCAVRYSDGSVRLFLRVLIPFDVAELADVVCWGVWVEVDAPTYQRVEELWNDRSRATHGPWRCRLANDLLGYPQARDLPGSIKFVKPGELPHFTFDPAVDHPFAEQARCGVSMHIVNEWQERLVNAAS